MREQDFIDFLHTEPSITSTANVKIRAWRAKNAETILGASLDVIASDDDLMYEALVELRKHEDVKRGHMQNAIRKYYKFCNGKEFPKLKDYHSAKHP